MVLHVATSYAHRPDEYIALLGSMAIVHPSDWQLVSDWAAQVEGPILDAGCGPGLWTGYLSTRGARVSGIDQVPAFLEHAGTRFPGIPFLEGNIDELPLASHSVGGVLAWYSLIHHDPDTIDLALDEFARVLTADGTLLVGFFVGADADSFDHAVAQPGAGRPMRSRSDSSRRASRSSRHIPAPCHSRSRDRTERSSHDACPTADTRRPTRGLSPDDVPLPRTARTRIAFATRSAVGSASARRVNLRDRARVIPGGADGWPPSRAGCGSVASFG